MQGFLCPRRHFFWSNGSPISRVALRIATGPHNERKITKQARRCGKHQVDSRNPACGLTFCFFTIRISRLLSCLMRSKGHGCSPDMYKTRSPLGSRFTTSPHTRISLFAPSIHNVPPTLSSSRWPCRCPSCQYSCPRPRDPTIWPRRP